MYIYKVSEYGSIRIYFKEKDTDHMEYMHTMSTGSTESDAIVYVNSRNSENEK